jgi:hypothetical protein
MIGKVLTSQKTRTFLQVRVGILVLLELKWIVCELSLTTAADLSLIISVTNKVPTKIG